MKGKSINVDTIGQLKTELVLVQAEFQPNLAIIFSGPDFDYLATLQLFKDQGIHVLGCTTAGEICNDITNADSCTILFMNVNDTYFKTFHGEYEGRDSQVAAEALGHYAMKMYSNPGILIYSAGTTVDGQALVRHIKAAIGKNIPIYGGLAGDNLRQQQTIVFHDEGCHSQGLAAVIFDTDKVQLRGTSYSGWNEIGRMHTVTKADGNLLYEIDNKPALQQFRKYFGLTDHYTKVDAEGLYSIPGQYPLKIFMEDGTTYLRSILLYDFKNNSIILAGSVNEGDQFKFCPTPDFGVVEETVQRYKNFAEDVSDVDAVIMNSCKARHFAFGPMFDDEVEQIFNIWNVPMAGYMAYGEIGNTGEEEVCEFHNVTCSLVTLTEKASA